MAENKRRAFRDKSRGGVGHDALSREDERGRSSEDSPNRVLQGAVSEGQGNSDSHYSSSGQQVTEAKNGFQRCVCFCFVCIGTLPACMPV